MEKLKSYFKTSFRQLWKSKLFFFISIFAFSLSIFTYFYSNAFNEELKEKLKESGSFENFRLFDHMPTSDFYWDEFHKFLAISNNSPSLNDSSYPIIGYANIIPASFIEPKASEKIVFASKEVFKLIGIETPRGNLGSNQYWAKSNLDVPGTLAIAGESFSRGGSFEEINKVNAYDFDIVIPIENLPDQYKNNKLSNIFLLVAPGFNAPEISKKAQDLFGEGHYAVRVWTESGISTDAPNASEYQFSEVLNIYSFSLFIVSFFLYFMITNILEKERLKELAIRKLYGDGIGNLFLRNLIDIVILISLSLVVASLISLAYYFAKNQFIINLDLYLLKVILIMALLTATFPALKNHYKSTREVISDTYQASTKPTFLYPMLLPALGFILAIFIFLNVSEKQMYKIIERKVSPYENNLVSVNSTFDKNDIDKMSFRDDIKSINLNDNKLRINFIPDRFALNSISLIEKLGKENVQFENKLISNSIYYYLKILSFYKYLFVIFTAISLLAIIGLVTFLIFNVRYDIAIMKMLGAKKKNVISFVSSYVIILILLSLPISWMSAFFMMSSWLGKFSSKASFEINDYMKLSLISGLVILTIGLSTGMQLYKRNIVKDIKTK